MRRVKPHVPNVEYPTSWTTPPAGVIKCNVDAAIFHNNTVGYGMCFRNSVGHFLMGKSAHLHSSISVLEAEAIALLAAINTAISLGYHNVMFETDSKLLADAINSSSSFNNELGDLLVQCRGLLATNFDFVVSFIRRQANRVAHSIARASLCHPSPMSFTLYHMMCTL
jgi:ribonuclease HI